MANRSAAGVGGKKMEIDPEELMRRKFRAKCRFRSLVRLVMQNVYWLIEDVDEYVGIDNVRRRVEQAVRAKTKKKRLLNINDKVLLNKPTEERTEQEKQYLYRIIGGLKCFKRYPNHVKKKLASLMYFKYYGPNRPIVRQHQEAHALYFIVTGEVTVSQTILDELLETYVSVDIGYMHQGDMFGEVSLLHNIPRTATVTTTSHCELLALMKEDFKNVLQTTVQKQWDEVREAMSAFTYFDGIDEIPEYNLGLIPATDAKGTDLHFYLSDADIQARGWHLMVARREGCIMAKMKSYKPNEILLGDGVSVPNFVYFVLSGRCQMIESLQVVVTTRLGRNYYTLYDPYVPEQESEQDLEEKYFKAYKNNKTSKESKGDLIGNLNEKDELPQSEKKVSISSNNPSEVEALDADNHSSDQLISDSKNDGQLKSDNQIYGHRSSLQKHSSKNSSHRSSDRQSSVALKPDQKSFSPSVQRTSDASTSEKLLINLSDRRSSHRLSVIEEIPTMESPENIRTYFMQVCIMNPGSSFGFGENMRDRRIVALTPVDCMLLPKIWLMQRNTANIWTRIQHYLEKKIPTKKQLFKSFVSARRWQEFQKQMVDDVVARSNTVNYTSVHDVPYSIRMEEMLDI